MLFVLSSFVTVRLLRLRYPISHEAQENSKFVELGKRSLDCCRNMQSYVRGHQCATARKVAVLMIISAAI